MESKVIEMKFTYAGNRSTRLRLVPALLLFACIVNNSACAQTQVPPFGEPDSISPRATKDVGNLHTPLADTTSREDSPGITYVATKVLVMQSHSSVARSFTGTLVAHRVSELGYKRIGRIEKLAADQGDRIRKGQILAELDTAILESEKAILAAQRDASIARLQELVAGPRQQTIDAAHALLAELTAVRDQLGSTYQRRVRLANSDAISIQDIEDARHQLSAAEAKILAQTHSIAELEEGTRKEQIVAQQAEVARLDASIMNVQVQIEESKLLAPYNAIVSRRLVDEGAIVQPGLPLFKIVELAPYEAWVGVPPEICSGLSVGKDYSLSLHGQLILARLKAIIPELDPTTRTQTVILDLDPNFEPNAELFQPVGAVGEIVSLNLEQSIEQTGFWLPVSALTRGVKGLWSVFLVLKEGQDTDRFVVQRSDVEIVQIDSNRVLINGTIKDGDRVVISGVQKLAPGQRVKLIEEDSAADSPSDLTTAPAN